MVLAGSGYFARALQQPVSYYPMMGETDTLDTQGFLLTWIHQGSFFKNNGTMSLWVTFTLHPLISLTHIEPGRMAPSVRAVFSSTNQGYSAGSSGGRPGDLLATGTQPDSCSVGAESNGIDRVIDRSTIRIRRGRRSVSGSSMRSRCFSFVTAALHGVAQLLHENSGYSLYAVSWAMNMKDVGKRLKRISDPYRSPSQPT